MSETNKVDLSEAINQSRKGELDTAKEALLDGKNVLISGKFVTGKTSFAKELLNMANFGKIWKDQKVKGVYSWTDHFLENDQMTVEDIKSLEKENLSVAVMDEIGCLIVGDDLVDESLVELFLKQVSELNEKGTIVVAVGYANKKLEEKMSKLFPIKIDFLSPPSTMEADDLENYEYANN